MYTHAYIYIYIEREREREIDISLYIYISLYMLCCILLAKFHVLCLVIAIMLYNSYYTGVCQKTSKMKTYMSSTWRRVQADAGYV